MNRWLRRDPDVRRHADVRLGPPAADDGTMNRRRHRRRARPRHRRAEPRPLLRRLARRPPLRGTTEQDAAYGNFDRCDVLVHRADGGVVAVERAVTVLSEGTLDRRPAAFPADSLAQQDACALLDASALEAVPGVDATQLAGRRALVRPRAEGEDTCLVKVVQRTFVNDRERTQDWLRRRACRGPDPAHTRSADISRYWKLPFL